MNTYTYTDIYCTCITDIDLSKHTLHKYVQIYIDIYIQSYTRVHTYIQYVQIRTTPPLMHSHENTHIQIRIYTHRYT